jgi:hypothetical protein
VNGKVGLVPEQRFLNLFCEESLGQVATGERRALEVVAGGLDNLDLKDLIGRGGLALGQHQAGLGQRECTAARGDENGGAGGAHG